MTTDTDEGETGGSEGVDRPRVLIVEDEADVRELYVDQLSTDYEVATARTGEEALALVDDAVDVVLLDRRLPGLHGDDTLRRIRESGVDVRVAVVTAVTAGLDVVGLPIDAYLRKPVDAGELRVLVDRLVRVTRYDDHVRQYYAITQKWAALGEAGHDAGRQELDRRRRALAAAVDDLHSRLGHDDYELLFQGLPVDHDGPEDLHA
ncbi:DNA-binding protein [Halobacteriales archaeon QS_6_71_20]|nr:MAG: DNA-binding protein [Halobacteriales archaeon QS_6_71_20]